MCRHEADPTDYDYDPITPHIIPIMALLARTMEHIMSGIDDLNTEVDVLTTVVTTVETDVRRVLGEISTLKDALANAINAGDTSSAIARLSDLGTKLTDLTTAMDTAVPPPPAPEPAPQTEAQPPTIDTPPAA